MLALLTLTLLALTSLTWNMTCGALGLLQVLIALASLSDNYRAYSQATPVPAILYSTALATASWNAGRALQRSR